MIRKQVFMIEMDDMQDNVWQGKLYWMQEGEEAPFHSSLEMLQLISSVVDGSENRDVAAPAFSPQEEESGDMAAGEARQRKSRQFREVRETGWREI